MRSLRPILTRHLPMKHRKMLPLKVATKRLKVLLKP